MIVKEKQKEQVPHVIKYMGSKRNLLDFITSSIDEIRDKEPICDLFAGSGVLASAYRNKAEFFANDIQSYSAVLSGLHLGSYEWDKYPDIEETIQVKVKDYVSSFKAAYPNLVFSYTGELTLDAFNQLERSQQELINMDFDSFDYHLFVKFYSGTYWSFEQCLYIDAFRKVAEEYKGQNLFNLIISSLMFAMSYNSQSTGHYAQYRDAGDDKSMKDILIYRKKDISSFFFRKFNELKEKYSTSKYPFHLSSKDYVDCLKSLPERTVVYADPPYCFVHYSRFYHALETLVRYDYPEVKFKGRYRTDRHQSPFCIRTQVQEAFKKMFTEVSEKKSKLILSYSNTGMITLEEILTLAKSVFPSAYNISVKELDYEHSTMGRKDDKSREVKELLVIASY